jgi:hypothetical protein
MQIDFNTIINARIKILEARKRSLEELRHSLAISEPIEFSINEIEKELEGNKKRQGVGVFKLNFLKDLKGPVVYIFEIADPDIKEELIDNLNEYRRNGKIDSNGYHLLRATAKIPSEAASNPTKILYVGSVKKSIHLRISQHLGLGHAKTFALQLKHWALPNWKFRFYYIKLTDSSMTTEFEAALSNEVDPLIGKREN